jgi:Uma2 family endonuclease
MLQIQIGDTEHMATVTTPLSLEDFHRLYDGIKPYREYWFGEAIPKSMPTTLHSAVQSVLIRLIHARGWKAFSELRLRIVRNAEPVPDVVASRNKLEQPYPTKADGVCVEILSPEDSLKRTLTECGYYVDWGFNAAWIVDPNTRSAWILTKENRSGSWIHPDSSLVAEGLEIPLPELFAEVDTLV